jgi:hypothetical protein
MQFQDSSLVGSRRVRLWSQLADSDSVMAVMRECNGIDSRRSRPRLIPRRLGTAVFALTVTALLAACDDGPSDVIEQVQGSAGRGGAILTFDVVVDGALPKGTPLDGHGLRASVSARDVSSELYSSGALIDSEGFSFDNATSGEPGPFNCDATSCRARLLGLLAGVDGEALEYSIRVAYAPDWDGSSPPDFSIDLVDVLEKPVKKLVYSIPGIEDDHGLVGAVVQLEIDRPVTHSPLGWFKLDYAELWRPSDTDPAFGCRANGCEQAREVVFANDVGGSPSGPMRIEGWLAATTEPALAVIDQTTHEGSVTATASSVVDQYQVKIEYPSRDAALPLLVDLEWTGDEFDEFFIDGEYAANRLRATSILANKCRETSCSFLMGRTSNPSLTDHPPSGLTVIVEPWNSDPDPDISIAITD